MERWQYIVRRALLMIPTFIGITLLCFAFCQVVPGGPVEQAILKMRGVGGGSESGRGGTKEAAAISEEQKKAIIRSFGFDRPILERYGKWLWTDAIGLRSESYKYPHKTVWQVISERFEVSLVFGITGFILTYLVCVPLGIAKALRNGTAFDFASSVLVFVGYAIPAFSFGMLLKMLFSGTVEGFWEIFPASGFKSAGHDLLPWTGRVRDVFMHMFLPVLCYVIGNFAVLTLLMKNSLLEQIGQDYVRAVLARGGTMKRAVWRHALRNAMIPIATGFGGVLSLLFAGSVLIEQVFEIPGMGLLSLEAIVGRDYMVFMGILAITSLLGMAGRLMSDICYMMIDPRISFK